MPPAGVLHTTPLTVSGPASIETSLCRMLQYKAEPNSGSKGYSQQHLLAGCCNAMLQSSKACICFQHNQRAVVSATVAWSVSHNTKPNRTADHRKDTATAHTLKALGTSAFRLPYQSDRTKSNMKHRNQTNCLCHTQLQHKLSPTPAWVDQAKLMLQPCRCCCVDATQLCCQCLLPVSKHC